MSDGLSPEDRKEAFDVVKMLDRLLSAGEFAFVDKFLAEMPVETITNPSYLLACVNYVRIAKDNGDILVQGPTFREKAFARMRQLVGDERAENLMRNR